MSAIVSLPHQGPMLDQGLLLDQESVPSPRAAEGHRPWCAVHTGDECQSEETTIAGSSLSVWLAAAGTERPRLVIDQPGDYIEIVVRD